jgi:alkylation response protein AidB-like acyl-CoA dehydrogenase
MIFNETAEETDRRGPLNDNLRSNIHHLIRAGYIGARVPVEYGGLGLSISAQRETLKLISAACGVTAFTQQQLHAGPTFVGACKDEELKKELLPKFTSGKEICGVGFSHLRRSGPPKVQAIRTADGFRINGVLPWISAWSLLDSFILGATVDGGNVIFCYLPIKEYRNSLFASTPLALSTMTASETVQVSLTDINLPSRYVLAEHSSDYMTREDYLNITGHIELPLGCALGSASFLRTLGQKTDRPSFVVTAEKIERKAAELESAALFWNRSRQAEPDYHSKALQARTGVITLAINAAAAAVAAVGGSGHLVTSPAQRRFRESAFYATQAQTQDIQQSLLEIFINEQ